MKTILKHKIDCNVFVKTQKVDRDMIYGHAIVIKNGSYIKSDLFLYLLSKLFTCSL